MTDPHADRARAERLDAAIARLPREVAPPPEILDALRVHISGARSIAPATPARAPGSPARRAWPALAAAAAVLIIATATLTRWTTTRTASTVVATALVPATETASAAAPKVTASTTPQSTIATSRARAVNNAPNPDVQRVLAAFDVYVRASRELESSIRELEAQSGTPRPAALDSALRVIDAAILAARRELGKNPMNSEAGRALISSYDQRLNLLKRTAGFSAGSL
jgi:hypothetical protein